MTTVELYRQNLAEREDLLRVRCAHCGHSFASHWKPFAGQLCMSHRPWAGEKRCSCREFIDPTETLL